MFKRFFMFALCAILLLSCAGGALAAVPCDEGAVVFAAVPRGEAVPGKQVVIDILIGGGDYEAHSLFLNIHYDVEMLTVVSVKGGEVWAELPDGSMKVRNYTSNSGIIHLGILCPTDPFTGHGVLITVTFTVSESCAAEMALGLEINNFFCSP